LHHDLQSKHQLLLLLQLVRQVVQQQLQLKEQARPT
jgi:hypothetical protein